MIAVVKLVIIGLGNNENFNQYLIYHDIRYHDIIIIIIHSWMHTMIHIQYSTLCTYMYACTIEQLNHLLTTYNVYSQDKN